MKLNLPNSLVIFRFILALFSILFLLLIPFFTYSDYPNLYISYANIKISIFNFIALIIFIIASFTDFLDGYLARKNNQITTFGKFFDPLADKILVNSVLIIFTVFGRIPIFMTLIFIIRDLLVDGLRMMLSSKGITLSAQKMGKYKTMFQFIGLSILFVIFTPSLNQHFNYNSINNLALIPLMIGMFFSIFSGFSYFYHNWNSLIG